MADNLFGKLKGSLEQVTNTVTKSIDSLPIPEQTKNVATKSIDLTKDLTTQGIEKLSTISIDQAKTTVNKSLNLAKEDLQINGTWSYKVVKIEFSELESLENILNELGKEKWEMLQLIENNQNFILVLKRPNLSYIANAVKLAIGREL